MSKTNACSKIELDRLTQIVHNAEKRNAYQYQPMHRRHYIHLAEQYGPMKKVFLNKKFEKFWSQWGMGK